MFWNIVIAIASFILNLVLAPKPQNAKPASLEDFDVPTAEEGIEIPVVFGTVHIKNPNCVWYGDFRAQAIKGKRRYGFFGPRQTIGHKYYLGMHMILCHGVHDEIREIWAGDKLLWPPAGTIDSNIPSGSADIFIDKANIFGGQEKEGGISGTVSILSGAPGQGQNAYLVSQLDEPSLPAFRGVVSAIWNHIYIGTNTYLKAWEFILKRIHKTSAGVTQWYDAKAAVPDTHTAASSAGVQLWRATTMNTDFKIDTNGEWAVRVEESQPDEVIGRLAAWHLPDGARQSYFPPDPFDYWAGVRGFAPMPHITEHDEIVVMAYGNPWAAAPIHLRFLNASNIHSDSQAYINLTAVFEDSSGWSNRSAGFIGDELNDYFFCKMGPHSNNDEPWLLLQRSSGSWGVHSYHDGYAWPGAGGVGTLSLGPKYAYCTHALGILRVCWNPSETWAETFIDLTPFIGAGIDILLLAHWRTTNEVVVVTSTAVYVFNEAMTALNRSRTSWPYPLIHGPTAKRFAASASTFLLHARTADYDLLWEVDAVSLETVKETNVRTSSYVNKNSNTGGPYYFNRDVSGLVIGNHQAMPISYWPYSFPEGLDMNPAHIIRECLTDKIWGMGYNAADIDDDSFTACADTLWDECFGLSLQWNREEKIEEFITVILSHIDAYLYLRRTTGKFYLKLIRDDYVLGSLPVFDEDDVVMWDEVARREPAEAVNSVIVKYTNRRGVAGMGRGKDSSHSFDNIGQIQQLGERISATRVYPGISRGDLAARVATRDQMSLGIGLISGRVTGKRTFDVLYPGDPFRVVSSRHNLDGEVMRVVSMKFGDGRDNKIGLKFAQDVFRLGAPDLIDTSEGDWENPSNPPAAVYPRLVWEAPYWHFYELVGAANAAAILAADADAGMLAMAGGQPTPDATHADIYVNGVEEETLDFAPAGTLSTAIGAFDTAIALDSAVDEDLIESGMLAAIGGSEIVRVTAVDGVDLTIARGLVDTVPQPHAAGESVVVFDGFSMSDFNARNAAATPAVRLLTTTSQGTLDYDVAPEDSVDLDSRAIRPLRPANVKVEADGVGPVDGSGLTDFDVTWSNRNRLTEIGTVLAWTGATGATVAPEAGQTTVIEVLDPAGTGVVTTHSGLAGTSFTVPAASFGGNSSGFIRVGAERDGYREWQAYAIEVYLVSIELLVLEDDSLTLGAEPLILS